MANRSEAFEFALAALVFIVGALLLLTWWLARTIGADFEVTGDALLRSVVATALLGLCAWRLEPRHSRVIGVALLAVLWAAWWPVVQSIAANFPAESVFIGDTEIFLNTPEAPWWSRQWFFWSGEGLLIALAAGLWLGVHNE